MGLERKNEGMGQLCGLISIKEYCKLLASCGGHLDQNLGLKWAGKQREWDKKDHAENDLSIQVKDVTQLLHDPHGFFTLQFM